MIPTVRSLVLGTTLAVALPLAGAAAIGPASAASATQSNSALTAVLAHRDAPGQDPVTLNGHGLYKVRLANTADGRIKVSWKWKKSRSKRLKKWKVVTSTSRKMNTDATSYRVKAKKRSTIVRHAPSVTPASGDYTFVKVYSLPKHGKKHGSAAHWIQAPVTAVPAGSGQATIGTYNVRDADLDASGPHTWANRKQSVINTINGSGAGIVNLQEASGMGKRTMQGFGGVPYQGSYLAQAQDIADGTGMRLVNDQFFTGADSASQGTRILYDANRYTLLTEGNMPIAGNRFIEWAEFTDPTGHRFWDLTMHLFAHTEKGSEDTRVQEAKQIIATAQHLNATDGAEVFVAGDSNSTIYTKPKGLVHRTFIGAGFYDAFATTSITNQAYPTTNDFDFPVKPSPHRRDLILSYGGPAGSYWYKNLFTNNAADAGSDHFMQVAQLPLS